MAGEATEHEHVIPDAHIQLLHALRCGTEALPWQRLDRPLEGKLKVNRGHGHVVTVSVVLPPREDRKRLHAAVSGVDPKRRTALADDMQVGDHVGLATKRARIVDQKARSSRALAREGVRLILEQVDDGVEKLIWDSGHKAFVSRIPPPARRSPLDSSPRHGASHAILPPLQVSQVRHRHNLECVYLWLYAV